jgi:hypothetical protein
VCVDDTQMAALDALGTRRTTAAGEYLFREGDPTYDFFVVVSGAVDIVVHSDGDEQVITELARGEALVSFLEGNGTPAMVERVMVRPPTGRIGPITPEERKAIMNNSPVKGKYDTAIDAESAYEMLQKRVAGTAAPAGGQDGGAGGGGILGQIGSIVGTIFGTNVSRGRMSTGQIIARNVTRSVTNKVVGGMAADLGKSVGGALGGSVGRALVRGALGGLLRR